MRSLDARSLALADAERLELAVQRRALHADEFGGARDVAAEAVDLREQIFALEHFARLAQRQPHELLAAVAVRHRRHHRADVLRQHAGADRGVGVAAGEDHQPLDVVAQLADVARPVVRLQHRHGVVADLALRQAGRLRNLLHEIVDEIGNVLAPLGQRRHADRHHRQPVIEVLAEAAGGDLGLDVAAGRGDDAHVDRDLGGAADALEGLVDQHAQDLVLRLARHVGDFVDEQRAAMRLLERADLALLRAVRLLDAEQLDLHALGRDRGGVDDDERPAARGRTAREMARGQLLAGARRADDQDAAVGRRDLLDRLAQLVDRRRAADHAGRHRRERLELLDLALEPRGLERAVGDQHQPVGLERLLDEVVGAALDRRDRGLDVAVAGDHHDRQVRMLLLDRVEQLQPVEPAALQPDVEEDQVRPPRLDLAKARVAVARGARAVALVLQDARDQLADIGFVVDDENVGRHVSIAR